MFKLTIKKSIGNTPLIPLKNNPQIYAKIEGLNFFGSAKDRAASYVIEYLLNTNTINLSTEIIESSSGNFAIALAGICKYIGLQFTCVVDPLLNATNRRILECLGANLITVTEPDAHNNFLQSRLDKVSEIVSIHQNIYWVNQYDNPLIPNAYFEMGKEIINQKPDVNYVFIPVSTCGTISGVSQVLKDYDSDIKIIAVDLDCSNIFSPAISRQHIPGMGLFKKPGNLLSAKLDEVIIVSEQDCIIECRKLLNQGIFVGASSGATIAAIKKLFNKQKINTSIVTIFPDRGDRYLNTIYSKSWCSENFSL